MFGVVHSLVSEIAVVPGPSVVPLLVVLLSALFSVDVCHEPHLQLRR